MGGKNRRKKRGNYNLHRICNVFRAIFRYGFPKLNYSKSTYNYSSSVRGRNIVVGEIILENFTFYFRLEDTYIFSNLKKRKIYPNISLTITINKSNYYSIIREKHLFIPIKDIEIELRKFIENYIIDFLSNGNK